MTREMINWLGLTIIVWTGTCISGVYLGALSVREAILIEMVAVGVTATTLSRFKEAKNDRS